MDNLFRTELIQPFAKPNETIGIGEWEIRNNEWSMCLRPRPFYKNLANENSGFLENAFQENTSYIFDLWFDNDDHTSGSTGFTIYFTDGTSDTSFRVNATDATGWQHRKIITPSNKTIKRLTLSYYANRTLYYRWDSYISPISICGPNKQGQLNTTQLTENIDINANIHKGGGIYGNNFYEY